MQSGTRKGSSRVEREYTRERGQGRSVQLTTAYYYRLSFVQTVWCRVAYGKVRDGPGARGKHWLNGVVRFRRDHRSGGEEMEIPNSGKLAYLSTRNYSTQSLWYAAHISGFQPCSVSTGLLDCNHHHHSPKYPLFTSEPHKSQIVFIYLHLHKTG